MANTLIFVLSGVIISNRVHTSSVGESADVKALDYAYALLLWVYLLVRLPPPPRPYPTLCHHEGPHARQLRMPGSGLAEGHGLAPRRV